MTDLARENLQRAIFGGSDSELSSDEAEISKPRSEKAPRPDNYPSSESEDDYRERRKQPKPKKRRIRKADTEPGRAKTKKRKRKPEPITEHDLSQLPPEQASKLRLDMQIEAILKSKKSSRPKKRKNNDEILDSFADDEVAKLRQAMMDAADEDQASNEKRQPAVAKLRMLPEAVETMQKTALAQSMIDNNLLDAVRRWLEPLPDRSLPALNIQREFFNIVRKMEFIDTSVLKESRLGRIVLFYTKCTRVTPDIQRIANELVSNWSRPIIKRSASYRDKLIPLAPHVDEALGPVRTERLNTILARAKANERGRIRPNAVSIPRAELGTYTVAPRPMSGARANASVDVDIERRKRNAERLRSLTRKVATNKA